MIWQPHGMTHFKACNHEKVVQHYVQLQAFGAVSQHTAAVDAIGQCKQHAAYEA